MVADFTIIFNSVTIDLLPTGIAFSRRDTGNDCNTDALGRSAIRPWPGVQTFKSCRGIRKLLSHGELKTGKFISETF